MATNYCSFVTAVARWCNGAGLLCLTFASILIILAIPLGSQSGSNGRRSYDGINISLGKLRTKGLH